MSGAGLKRGKAGECDMGVVHRLYVTWVHDGTRLDVFIHSLLPDISRTKAKELSNSGKVLVNGVMRKASYVVREGEVVEVEMPDERRRTISEQLLTSAKCIPIEVLYEDEHLLIVNKPRGIVVHPSHTTSGPTLMHALLAAGYKLSDVCGESRLGIVHRLDKDTSGCIIITKTNEAHLNLQKQFSCREVNKRYIAIIVGNPNWNEMHIAAPIGRDASNRQRMAIVECSGKHAETHFTVIERYGEFSLVEARMLTGRTHQVRVHASHLGYPIAGDAKYNGRKRALSAASKMNDAELLRALTEFHGQALHALEVNFCHPIFNRQVNVTAPMPYDMQRIIERLRKLNTIFKN
ncbi:MAG: RluA family pseudouridine synthase [Armatimonadota bacterium]|nr:RluA family pseudouridine synthase [Armatimonadota bacterium]MCX7776874.1 RluA family pseudouridine synthase [Armatimonadota bacterium]MDW8024440.1 RluA family pseudouridine synthase [Armatimonadota bacterium]